MKKILILIGIILIGVAGAYFLVRKVSRDRQSALNFTPPIHQLERRTANETRTQTKTYTKEELDEMRKKGKMPTDLKQPYTPPQANSANDAAVQRSLRTIDEINRINDMNQRLLDQQQRMNRK